jgi:serine/arginine repetitive matrix protein 2
LKAGALCGIGQDESYARDEKVPSSSRVDIQGIILIGGSPNAESVSDAAKVSPSPSVPSGEVGIAISSSPPEGSFDLNMSEPRHQEGDEESRWSSKHTHKSSGYAGPHPSAIDSNLPQLGGASGVSLRHRLPPRAAIHPPIAPIAHPYQSATAHVGNKGSEGATLKVTEAHATMEPGTGRTPYISLSHADFEQYGVGEALVYASHPRPGEVPEVKQADVQSESSPGLELPPPREQSHLCETVVLPPEERDTYSLAMASAPSLTNSTLQMVMSAFDNPDDLDEFQDLFYKPYSASGGQPSVTISQVPADVHSSTSSSPLTHLLRKLSEEVNSRRDPSRTPSDPILLQRSESQDDRSNQSGAKFVFMDLARSSSSPAPMESSSQLHVPIQEGSESTAQPVMVIPEDVHSSYASSVLESPLEEQENDTFGKDDLFGLRNLADVHYATTGYPVKHGQFEVATAPTTIQSPLRLSTHLSIQEDETDGDDAFLSPVTRRYGLISVDAARASYLTTSDVSQMSGLSDFPLPPSARPISMMQAYFEALPVSPVSESYGQPGDGAEIGQEDRHTDSDEDEEPSGDVGETLRALRTTPRITSYEPHRSTFGGSDDMDFITQVHQGDP